MDFSRPKCHHTGMISCATYGSEMNRGHDSITVSWREGVDKVMVQLMPPPPRYSRRSPICKTITAVRFRPNKLSGMQPTLHTSRRTYHGTWRWVIASLVWQKNRRATSPRCRYERSVVSRLRNEPRPRPRCKTKRVCFG